MRTRLSVCRRKARFGSERDAVSFAQDANLRLRPYRCDRCGQVHLTSRTKGKWMPPPVLAPGSGGGAAHAPTHPETPLVRSAADAPDGWAGSVRA
jgi:hypothetical protein